jgi:hypothetical protein
MGRVVPILVRPLLCHPFFPLPLEAKLILVTLFPTIATTKPHKLRFRLGWGCSLSFSPLNSSTDFSSLAFSLSFQKNTFPEVLTNLIGFWRSFVGVGNMGGAGVVSSRFLRWLGFGGKSFLWWVFGGSGIFSPLPSPTLFAPSP